METKTISIGFVGSQYIMSKRQQQAVHSLLAKFLSEYKVLNFHHSGIKGADEQIHDLARSLDLLPICISSGEVLVDRSQVIIGAPETSVQVFASDSAWSVLRYAHVCDKPRYVFDLDGELITKDRWFKGLQ